MADHHAETRGTAERGRASRARSNPDWPSLNELSLRYIHHVLLATGGNKSHAAEILGIDRRTINRIFAAVRAGRMPSMSTFARDAEPG